MINEILEKMIEYSNGYVHDIDHFKSVLGYSQIIAKNEGISSDDRLILEIAAIVHDIACPTLREKYGHCGGKLQEIEGPGLARDFLKEFEIADDKLNRILYLVGHHHTPEAIDGIDYQILLEADYIVNAIENSFSKEDNEKACRMFFKTPMGIKILNHLQ